MAKDLILGVDLGTSGPKVALMNQQGEIVAWKFQPTQLTLLADGGAEQDPDDWWQAICGATRALIDESAIDPARVRGIGVTAQWSGAVAVGKDGKALMPSIIWLDTRGSKHLGPLVGGWPKVEGYNLFRALYWIHVTGGIPGHAGKDSIAHVLYLKNERPDIYAATDKFLEPKDYLNLRLTGRAVATHDSMTLFWLTDTRRIDDVRYVPRMLKTLGIAPEKLPPMHRAVDVIGELTAEAAADLGLPAGIEVVGGTPDLHSAAVGSGAIDDYATHLYLGTSSWITCHLAKKKSSLETNMATLPAAIPGRYVIGNSQESAGACLTYAAKMLFDKNHQPEDVYLELNHLADAAAPGSEQLIFTPWLYGERTPTDDSTIRGGFFNMSLKHGRAEIARAVFEGVAYNGRWLLEGVESFIGRRAEPIRVIGGGAKSDLWCQIHADIFNRTILQMQEPILANVRGAAIVAAVGLEMMTFADAATCTPVAREYRPDPINRAIYDKLYAEFLQIYKSTRKICARINGG